MRCTEDSKEYNKERSLVFSAKALQVAIELVFNRNGVCISSPREDGGSWLIVEQLSWLAAIELLEPVLQLLLMLAYLLFSQFHWHCCLWCRSSTIPVDSFTQ